MNKKDKIRFLSKIRKSNKCWTWIGTIRNKNGYGTFKLNRKNYGAHRLSWELFNKSKIPKNLCVCHSCDNRRCVNPKHLFIGTYMDNYQDAVKKGRIILPIGILNKSAKLTEKEVKNIRKEYIYNVFGYRKLAKKYGVERTSIQNIIKKQTWAYL